MRFWKVMAEYDAEGTTYSACAGGAAASPYTPDFSGRLIALRTIVGGDAATTLTELVQFKLTCTKFGAVTVIEAIAAGGGLRTAPFPQPPAIDHVCDVEVQAGVPITIEARDVTADTPVTNSVLLLGLFEV